MAILTALFRWEHAPFVVGQAGATVVALVNNFALNNILTYGDRRLRGWDLLRGWISFMVQYCSVCRTSNGAVRKRRKKHDSNAGYIRWKSFSEQNIPICRRQVYRHSRSSDKLLEHATIQRDRYDSELAVFWKSHIRWADEEDPDYGEI